MEWSGSGPGLDTVRALHQTVVALRAALEQSKSEILELKSKAWPLDSVQDALRTLSIENHVLRQKLIDSNLEVPERIEGPFELQEDQEELIGQAIESHLEGLKRTDEDDSVVHEDKDVEVGEEPEESDKESEDNEEEIREEDIPEEEISEEELKKEPGETKNTKQTEKPKKVTIVSPTPSPKGPKEKLETKIFIKAECISPRNISRSLESLTILRSPLKKKFRFSKTISFSNIPKVSRDFHFVDEETDMSDKKQESTERQDSKDSKEEGTDEALSPQNDLDQDQEVDDIELIFTTDDTKDSDFKDQMISIETGEVNVEATNALQLPLSDLDQNFDVSDRELDDDVFNDTAENENQEKNFQSFDSKKENSQIFNSKSDNSINHEEKSLKSYYSYQDSSFENKSLEKDESFDRFEERVRIVETDISKCGIHEVEYSGSRRNTCPNPIQYRPLMHREALARGINSRKSRPILTHSNAIRKDSGAQTDISALPNSSWRSESSLANKARMGENFTTLPSKFPMPASRLRLSDKTVEARRVLLSDIGFTSMVPELSRSADHLCPANVKPPTVTTYGQFLRTTDLYSPGCTNYQSQKFTWTATTATPSESSQTQSRYSSVYPLASPPAPSRRCSAPVSPSRRAMMMKPVSSKVRFANGSLPELRTDWNSTVDSGDSTDSLVEEAENYLRRSIDCIMTGREMTSSYSTTTATTTGVSTTRRAPLRRASAPEPDGGSVPPAGWQPFLPRTPRDLRPDHWVKVIAPEGRVRGGRVRYIGPVSGHAEPCVGVQLSTPDGVGDGTCSGRRYFQCEPYHGIFVPFRKVIMGWRP